MNLKFSVLIMVFALVMGLNTNAKPQDSHAKELLGKYFHRSPAAKPLSKPLKDLLIEELQSELSRKYKRQTLILAETILAQSEKYNLDPLFVLSVIKTESHFNPEAVGSVGELGLMQIRPETALWIANKFQLKIKKNITEELKRPVTNIILGTAYLAFLRDHFSGAAALYLPAYNAGPNKVKAMTQQKIVPKKYSMKVMRNYRDFYSKWTEENQTDPS